LSVAKQPRNKGEAVAPRIERYAGRLDEVERVLDYQFKDRLLLLLALTHPSASESTTAEGSYERLEFLGDAILGAVISRELYDSFPHLDEGALTRLKVSAVAGHTLAKLADELGLGELIIFGSSERGTGKRGLQSAMENVYEALVAALAIDGGTEEAQRFVVRTLTPMINTKAAREPENPKSVLQEILQAQRITPTYEIVATEGPPHDRYFTARVLADKRVLATGSGHSKKDAEMDAATEALRILRAETRRANARRVKAKTD
jgi:ribonuclease-3